MNLKGRSKQIYLSLKQRGLQGLTVIEAMELGLGTELRKNVTTLNRYFIEHKMDSVIEKHPEHKNGRHWIRYILIEQPKVFTIVDPMNGNKQEVLV